MRSANIVQHIPSHALDQPSDIRSQYTPGQFFKEAGTVIAGCLALGLLMQVLLG
jgi:hypothetical protein